MQGSSAMPQTMAAWCPALSTILENADKSSTAYLRPTTSSRRQSSTTWSTGMMSSRLWYRMTGNRHDREIPSRPAFAPLSEAGPTIGMIMTPAAPAERATAAISSERPYPGPMPGTTKARLPAWSTTAPTAVSYSSRLASYTSPVPHIGIRKSAPFAIRNSALRRTPPTSTRPSPSRGVIATTRTVAQSAAVIPVSGMPFSLLPPGRGGSFLVAVVLLEIILPGGEKMSTIFTGPSTTSPECTTSGGTMKASPGPVRRSSEPMRNRKLPWMTKPACSWG